MRHSLLAGAALALLGSILSLLASMQPLEEAVDLHVLFHLRGPVPPPRDIVLVTIDQPSAERISLPRDPQARARCDDLRVGDVPPSHERLPPPHLVLRWPRCIHAQAVRALTAAGARVIGLDISFRPLSAAGTALGARLETEQDQALAAAIEAANRVLLAQWLDPVESRRARSSDLGMERPAQISPPLESSALGAAPLRLISGLSGRVDGFATFSEEETPISSFPALTLQLASADVYDDLLRLIARADPEAAEMLPADAERLLTQRPLQATSIAIRSLLASKPDVADSVRRAMAGADSHGIPASHRDKLQGLVDLYTGEAGHYLNFYGYAGTFTSISYADVLKGATDRGQALRELFDKTVLVGYADFTPAQRDDHYPTVYTTRDGVKLSGVEILATALANLESRSSLIAPPALLRVAIAAMFGFTLAPLLMIATPVRGLFGAGILWAGYLAVSLVLFRSQAVWLPILVPLGIQAPAAVLYATAHHYRDLKRKREELRALFGKFVPQPVIETLLQKRSEMDSVTEPVYGICLATDAERFSTLAESMHPGQLARLLNRYFEAVFPPITRREGVISDIIGDMVLAFWTGVDANPAAHAKACAAALELKAAVDEFNATSTGGRLPTRIGISAGPVTTSAIGAFDRFEFRPIGDTVVTSARLQELSKMLGTRILATEPVVQGLKDYLVRDVGTFVLRGKKQPSHVFELIGERDRAPAGMLQLCLEFALALDALRAGGREQALARFRAIRDRYPQDGPTTFYVRWISSHRSWNGDAIPQP